MAPKFKDSTHCEWGREYSIPLPYEYASIPLFALLRFRNCVKLQGLLEVEDHHIPLCGIVVAYL
ncbi:hypothetical protein Hdeb2414_s0016g00489531 [Helianthus debilis subsp. tardiflorus]